MLLLCLTALAADTVTVQVSGAVGTVEARSTWLGVEQRTVLTDPDGGGVLTGSLSGDEIRLLPLSLWVDGQEGWRGLVPLGMGEQTLSFTTLSADPPTLQQAAAPIAPARIAQREAGLLVGWFAWLLAVLGGLVWLTRRSQATAESGWKWWWSVPIWSALSVLWTWPAATAGGGAMVGRHFDILGTLWAMDASGRLLSGGFFDPLTAWPLGHDASRFDSFTLLPIGALLADLGVDRVHGALQLVGVFLLGIGGEAFARGLGARGPWGLVGGAALALSGLSANVLHEGHVYHLLNPWLPLLGLAWWRACGAESRWWWGAVSGVLFGLCLLTTAYIGVAAALLVACFALPALPRRKTWPALGAAAVVAAAFAVPYVALFLGGEAGSRGDGNIRIALDLAALAPLTPETLRSGFGRTLAPSAALLALALAGIALRVRGHRLLLVTALVALAMAAFPLIAVLIRSDLFRFPVRLGWTALLCLGGLAALGGSRLEALFGRRARVLLLLAVIEPLIVGWPGHSQHRQLSTTPAAYRSAAGPVLDLLPQDTDQGASLGVTLSRLTCFYQTRHRLPLAEDCFESPVRSSPRVRLGKWVRLKLLEGEHDAVRQQLQALGFAAVALQPDLFHSADRDWLTESLARLDVAPVVSTSGGAHVRLYRLTPQQPHQTDLSVTDARRVEFPDLSGVPAGTGTGSPQARVALMVPDAYSGSGFEAVLSDHSGRTWRAPLTDDGTLSRDVPGDRLWVGQLTGPLPPGGTLQLVLKGPQFDEVAWTGSVSLEPGAELVFLLSVSQSQIVPILTPLPDSASPPITPHNRTVIAAGWLAWLVAAGLVAVRLRQRLSRSQTADPASSP